MTAKGLDKVDDPLRALQLSLESQRNLEQLKRVGEAELLRVPRDLELESDAMGEVFAKLGRPETAEGYELPELPGQVEGESDLRPEYAGLFHQLGLLPTQATGLIEGVTAIAEKVQADANEAAAIQDRQAWEGLRREWGAAFDERNQQADSAAARLGVNRQGLEGVLGRAGAANLLQRIGAAIGEGKVPSGSPGEGGGPTMTPAEAKDRIDELMGTPAWKESWQAGDARKIQQLLELNRLAAGLRA